MKTNFEDEELDRLFKNKADDESETPDFDAGAWADMEKRLDRRKRRALVFYLSAAVFFFGMLGIGWFFRSQNSDASSSEKMYAARASKDELNGKQVQKATRSKGSPLDSNPAAADDASPGTAGVEKPDGIPFSSDEKIALTLQQSKEKARHHYYPLTDRDTIALANHSMAKIQIADLNKSAERALIAQHQSPAEPLNIRPALRHDDHFVADLKDKATAQKVSWQLGFNIGPEFNTAGNFSQSLGNLNGGADFSGVWNKFRVSMGANYGIKSYTASTSQYHHIKPQLINEITNIDASCDILEIPVTFSYLFHSSKKSSIEINAGLSSYFMLKERYIYQYQPSSGYKDYSMTLINKNQHYFKVLQLSGTYHIPLKTSHSALGFTPFVKLPLSGVGQGEVKLKSYGVSLNLSYGFRKKQQ